MDSGLSATIYAALLEHRPLDKLLRARERDRIDARGFQVPRATEGSGPLFQVGPHLAALTSTPPQFDGFDWRGVDFTGSDFYRTMFCDGRIENCIFDSCNFERAGFWRCNVKGCSFRSARLRSTVLGSVEPPNPRPNIFTNDCFDRADMRESVNWGEHFCDCSFKGSRMDRVRFEGSVFERCAFEGMLYDVAFFPVVMLPGIRGLPSNKLEGCDFGPCTLRYVDFRNIDLTDVKLPQDRDHIILRHGARDLLIWKKALQIDPQANDYINALAARVGTPGLVHVDAFDFLTSDQISELRRIASSA